MKKMVFVVMLLMGAMSFNNANAVQRMVVAEDFTATWCSWCPDAAKALDSLYRVARDTFIVIAYHPSGSDPFQTAGSVTRANYYHLMYYPTVFFCGGDTNWPSTMVGSFGSSTYDSCRIRFDSLKATGSSLEMEVNYLSYDDVTRSGQMAIRARNVSGASVAGRMHFLVLERGIPYYWQSMSELDFLARDMIPDGNGEEISIGPGDSLSVVRDYVIGPDWVFGSCMFAAFLQTPDRNIAQAAQSGYGPCLTVERKVLTETAGNGNGFYEPGESGAITVWARNRWKDAQGASITITSQDSLISITNGIFPIGGMLEDDSTDNHLAPFAFTVLPSANMPDGHLVTVNIHCRAYHPGLNDTVEVSRDSVKFLVGSPYTIYLEDFENGLGGWSTGYVGNYAAWDTTGESCHSPDHCITDSKGGDYPNTSSHWIQMSGGIDLRPYGTATLSWWEKYFTDFTGDRCRVERSINGGASWSELKAYSGIQSDWAQNSYDLTSFCGDTISDFRLRFKMTSNSSQTADGWYVDDVMILGYTKTGVAGRPVDVTGQPLVILRGAYPSPAVKRADIEYQLAATARIRLKVYNIAGELVRTLTDEVKTPGIHRASWDGRDFRGSLVSSGVYLYQLEAGGQRVAGKMTYLK